MKNEKKPLIEVAYEVLVKKKGPLSFKDLFAEVCRLVQVNEENKALYIAQFHSSINLDGRFLQYQKDSKSPFLWDLKSRHTISEIKPNLSDLYGEVVETETGDVAIVAEEENEEIVDEEEEESEEIETTPSETVVKADINED
ncbi:MAG: DNA-directed RNA polymerase subunit delta [Bacillales bacterium]|jgi:DNA-directed RNA polymerase subunit delta|nr:DNA-directed RNA polymerase subunit delta [Bacillales bacterium]